MKKFLFYLSIFYLSSVNSGNQKSVEDFVGAFCRAKNLVFDIGANVGIKTDMYLEHGAQVVCIEPQPACIKKLKEKYAKNKQVIIVEKAIAEKCGTLEMYICTSESDSALSSLSDKWVSEGRFSRWGYKWNKQTEIETTTLDELVKLFGVPSFCKIDVEGFEVQVLSGLSTKIPLLSFEFTIEFIDDAKKCMFLLSKVGNYRYNVAFGVDTNFAFKKWQSSENVIKKILKYAETHKNAWGDIYAFGQDVFAKHKPIID